MGKTCAVGLCKSGYKGHTGIKIHGFPDDDAEGILWKNALNIKLDPNKNLENVGVCVKHWPPNYPTKKTVNGRLIPANVPTVFDTPRSFTPQTF